MARETVRDQRGEWQRKSAIFWATEIVLMITPQVIPETTPLWVYWSLYGVAALLAVYAAASYLLAGRYWSVPRNGVGVFLAAKLHENPVAGRRRLVTFYYNEKVSLSVFLTASGNFAIEVTDLYGEDYTLEVRTGKNGVVPWLSWFTIGAEFAREEGSFRLRLLIDGEVAGEREYDLPIVIGEGEWGSSAAVGAKDGAEHGHFTLGGMALLSLGAHDSPQARKAAIKYTDATARHGAGLYFSNGAEMVSADRI